LILEDRIGRNLDLGGRMIVRSIAGVAAVVADDAGVADGSLVATMYHGIGRHAGVRLVLAGGIAMVLERVMARPVDEPARRQVGSVAVEDVDLRMVRIRRRLRPLRLVGVSAGGLVVVVGIRAGEFLGIGRIERNHQVAQETIVRIAVVAHVTHRKTLLVQGRRGPPACRRVVLGLTKGFVVLVRTWYV
jgi:hypothetical protein